MDTEISSRTNSIFKELKKSIREKNKYLYIEGKKLLDEALNSSVNLEAVYVGKNDENYIEKILQKKKNTKIIYLKNELIAEIFTTENKPDKGSLALGVAKRPAYHFEDLFKAQKNLIFLDEIQDPGNLGTIIRSSLAFNCGGIILTKNSVDPFNTKVIRASAGSVFKIPILTIADFRDFCKIAHKNKYKICGTSSSRGADITKLNISGKHVFAFGNEGHGLSAEIMENVDSLIKIPHSEQVESLNLSVAVSIILWEVF